MDLFRASLLVSCLLPLPSLLACALLNLGDDRRQGARPRLPTGAPARGSRVAEWCCGGFVLSEGVVPSFNAGVARPCSRCEMFFRR